MTTKLPPPQANAPLFGLNGVLTQFWADWFHKAWLRMGASEAYTNSEISANNFITFARMQDIATDRLMGRDTAGSGDPEEISVGGGLEFTGSGGIQRGALTGDVTASAGSGATTIANGAVSFIKQLSTDWTSSKAASGYTKLPNGIYLQWGVTASTASAATATVTFPIAFPTGCLQVVAGIRDNSGVATTATGQVGAGSFSTTQCSLFNRTSVAQVMNWWAVGH